MTFWINSFKLYINTTVLFVSRDTASHWLAFPVCSFFQNRKAPDCEYCPQRFNLHNLQFHFTKNVCSRKLFPLCSFCIVDVNAQCPRSKKRKKQITACNQIALARENIWNVGQPTDKTSRRRSQHPRNSAKKSNIRINLSQRNWIFTLFTWPVMLTTKWQFQSTSWRHITRWYLINGWL